MKVYALILLFLVFKICLGQQTKTVDFITIEAIIKPVIKEKTVFGDVKCTFKIKQKCDSVYLDARDFILDENNLENAIKITSNDNKIWLISNFKPGKTYTVLFSYMVFPKKALYFINDEIWTQGQGKYTSNWLPSIDDMNDKIIFDISIEAPLNKVVIANGKLSSVIKKDSLKIWKYDMLKPMSSYLVGFAIGDFVNQELSSENNIPIKLYYKIEDSLKAEPTYRYTQKIFNFLETEIGVPYPWQNYKQVPVKDFMYAGMENTTATFFSESFVVDSVGFTDHNYINVNAHELAHQWFGDLVTEVSSKDHWLHEGFATYYALLAEREIFGEDYYYWKLFQSAEQLKLLSDEGKGESLINPKASSLTFYEKGAWALHILNEKVGDEVFKTAIKNYLEKYKFKNVTTNNFIFEVEKLYGKKLTSFEEDWIYQSAFKAEEAYQSLIKSSFINNYFKISALREISISSKIKELEAALTFPNDFIGQEVVYQLKDEPMFLVQPIYKKAFSSNNVYVRQAIALSLDKIPKELKTEYESLLTDNSYATQEAALGNLWTNFPEDRLKYLNITNGVIGFHDKNIRQLWLFLAIITEDYKPKSKGSYLTELKQYTASKYSNKVREKAFEYINYATLWDEDTLLNLIDACDHHYWRFKKYSRAMFTNLAKNKTYRVKIIKLIKNKDNPSPFLIKILNEE